VDVPASAIAPQAEGKVVVHWAPAPGSVGAVDLAIDVQTNDPKNKSLRFTISGNIQPTVRVFVEGKETMPGEFFSADFGDNPIPPGEKRTREVKVFSTSLRSFDLRATCSVPGFDIPQPARLPAGARVGDYDVACGYSLEVSTTKDLPLGYVSGDLNLTLSNQSDGQPDRTVPVPVRAVVGQGVCTVSPAEFRFSKPDITDEDTAKVRLTFINPPAKEEVSVESAEPSFVQVDKPERGLDGKWLITAHLPKNNAEAAKCQSDPPMIGKVLLKVSGLDRPVTVRVKWEPLPK
jgi:hypothetical protein